MKASHSARGGRRPGYPSTPLSNAAIQQAQGQEGQLFYRITDTNSVTSHRTRGRTHQNHYVLAVSKSTFQPECEPRPRQKINKSIGMYISRANNLYLNWQWDKSVTRCLIFSLTQEMRSAPSKIFWPRRKGGKDCGGVRDPISTGPLSWAGYLPRPF